MSELATDLRQLADRFGIACEFWDWKGRHTAISDETIVAILAALDIDASSPQACAQALQQVADREWQRVLPACTVAEEGKPLHLVAHVPVGRETHFYLELENGEQRPTGRVDNSTPHRQISDRWFEEITLWLGDDLPLGYHRILAQTPEGVSQASVIITPTYVGFPKRMGSDQIWGYSTQLYSIAANRGWGVGDLSDLADLITWAGAEQGADYVLINPLHAAESIAPMEPSPYLPASRRFVNPLYIRPETILEYGTLKDEARARIQQLRSAVAEAAGDGIDRDGVWKAKREALEIVFRAGRRAARQLAFEHFLRENGEALRRFATWSVLCEELGSNWRTWDPQYQQPGSVAVQEFVSRHQETVAFYEWMQWVASTQLSQAQTVSEEVGMRLGLVTDLAVGVNTDGAETWMNPEVFAQGVKVGAPPDQYNQTGQDWGQPPWRPDKLAELSYEPFRKMVAASLRRAGGVRIDHIIGLFRLWWIPAGKSAKDGAYVRNDHEALIGILALEAQRAQALVIGEDLGTVEPWARDYLAHRGLLGTSVLWFEADHEGNPLEPQHWREYCMASVTTHDLPPTVGYLAGDHIHLAAQLGLLTEPLENELAHSQAMQQRWVAKLQSAGLLADEDSSDPVEIMLALHRYLRSAPSRVLVAALADAVGERRTQNQPGTINEYPNWRVPLGDAQGKRLSLEEVFESELARRLADALNSTRRNDQL